MMIEALPKTKGPEKLAPVVVALKPLPVKLAGSKCTPGGKVPAYHSQRSFESGASGLSYKHSAYLSVRSTRGSFGAEPLLKPFLFDLGSQVLGKSRR